MWKLNDELQKKLTSFEMKGKEYIIFLAEDYDKVLTEIPKKMVESLKQKIRDHFALAGFEHDTHEAGLLLKDIEKDIDELLPA